MAVVSALTLTLRARRDVTRRLRAARRVPPHVRPRVIEVDYLGIVLPILRRARELVDRYVLPAARAAASSVSRIDSAAHLDGGIDILESAMDAVERELARDMPSNGTLIAQSRSVAHQVDAHNSRELSSQIRAKLDIDVIGRVPALEDRVSAFTRQNVQLIKSLPADYLHDIEQATLRAVREGTRAEDLAALLEDRFGVASNRAALIAQDQVGKFYGELNKARQTNLGIDTYTWQNVGDERVSGNPGGKYPDAEPSHWDRQGEVYSWRNPPEGGHPGNRPRCRCWAEPNLDALL